jgi:hypothetical protein
MFRLINCSAIAESSYKDPVTADAGLIEKRTHERRESRRTLTMTQSRPPASHTQACPLLA